MKTVLVTGASSGIGREFAKIYAKNGCNIIVVARREDRLIELKEYLESTYSIDIEYITLDLSKTESAKELYEKVKHKNIDILINNAGFGTFGDFDEINYQKEVNMINLNILTLTNLTRLFLADMKIKDNGKIINIASTAAFQPVPYMASYAATKAYVLHLSIALNTELHNSNVSVVAVCPGATKSEFQQAAEMGEPSFFRGKLPTSEELALYAYNQINRNKTLIVHGFYNKFLILIERFLTKKTISEIIRKTI